MTLTNMQYQRRQKQYQVLDPESGDVECFPPGHEGHRNAMRRAVYFQNARLSELVICLVNRWPILEARAWRAAILSLNENVEDQRDGAVVARVFGNSEYGPYIIQTQQKLLTCDCLDYVDGGAPYLGSNGQRVCKHILAVQFSQRLRVRICGSCNRKVDEMLMICPFCHGEVTPY